MSLELKLHVHLEFDLDLQLEYQICAKYTPQSNDLALFACHASRSIQKPNWGTSTTYKHISNLRTFQSKWLLNNPINVTFLADSVPFKEKFISPNVHFPMPQNFVEMCVTKSSSSYKKWCLIWLLDCYQISNLAPLLHAENFCTIANKIY